ncbi:hypothetical protein FI667_g8085, partial [Globisporangium splendens]
MQLKTTIVYAAVVIATITCFQDTPSVHAEEMTYTSKGPATISPARIKIMQNEKKVMGYSPYAKLAGVDLDKVDASTATAPVVAPAPVAAAPVISSYGKEISPARIKIMQNEKKAMGYSPYAKMAGVDLDKLDSASGSAPAPTTAASSVASVSDDAPISPERVQIIKDEIKELGYSPHAQFYKIDLKEAGIGSGGSAPPANGSKSNVDPASAAATAVSTAVDAANATVATAATTDVVETGPGY